MKLPAIDSEILLFGTVIVVGFLLFKFLRKKTPTDFSPNYMELGGRVSTLLDGIAEADGPGSLRRFSILFEPNGSVAAVATGYERVQTGIHVPLQGIPEVERLIRFYSSNNAFSDPFVLRMQTDQTASAIIASFMRKLNERQLFRNVA